MIELLMGLIQAILMVAGIGVVLLLLVPVMAVLVVGFDRFIWPWLERWLDYWVAWITRHSKRL